MPIFLCVLSGMQVNSHAQKIRYLEKKFIQPRIILKISSQVWNVFIKTASQSLLMAFTKAYARVQENFKRISKMYKIFWHSWRISELMRTLSHKPRCFEFRLFFWLLCKCSFDGWVVIFKFYLLIKCLLLPSNYFVSIMEIIIL